MSLFRRMLLSSISQAATPGLNFIGVDENGVYEGQEGYTGNIVGYAVGKTDDTGSFTYANAFSKEVYGENAWNSYYDSGSVEIPKIFPEKIIIPDSYNGKPVIEICESAFDGFEDGSQYNTYSSCYWIEEIKLGKNIQTIGNYALKNDNVAYDVSRCKNLKSIGSKAFAYSGIILNLPSTVEKIGSYAFRWSPKITVNSNISYIGTSRGYGMYDGVTTTVFTTNVTEVKDRILYEPAKNQNLVFMHSDSDPITFKDLVALKSATAINIYTDNTYVRNYDWSALNLTVTFYPLSDWIEE